MSSCSWKGPKYLDCGVPNWLPSPPHHGGPSFFLKKRMKMGGSMPWKWADKFCHGKVLDFNVRKIWCAAFLKQCPGEMCFPLSVSSAKKIERLISHVKFAHFVKNIRIIFVYFLRTKCFAKLIHSESPRNPLSTNQRSAGKVASNRGEVSKNPVGGQALKWRSKRESYS